MISRYLVRLIGSSLLGFVLVAGVYIPAHPNPPVLKGRFQAELDTLRHQFGFPGATAAYTLPDGTAEVFATGLADVELKIPMVPQSRMLAASIGKTFVGATILSIAQEGVLTLDDPVSKWLGDRPWFSRLPNHETITLRQLLNHTSGIPNHVESEQFMRMFGQAWQNNEHPAQPEELIAFVLDRPPLFKAGDGWHYTDTGYLLLGLVIEKVAGHSYYEEVTRRFLEPLHLKLTTPSDRLELPGLTAGYMAEESAFGLPSKTTSEPGVMVWHPGIEWTGGGLVSNSKDLVLWAKALFEGEAIAGDYLQDLLQTVPVSKDDSTVGYGIAVAIHKGGPLGPSYGHGGWIPGYCSSLRYYPQYRIAVAFEINTDIGIVDDSTPVIEEMESRLAAVVAKASRK